MALKYLALALLSFVSLNSCKARQDLTNDSKIESSQIKVAQVVSDKTQPKKYHYHEGRCLNDAGEQGFNPPSSIVISAPEEKLVMLQFGVFRGGISTYYEIVDAECVNFDDGSLKQNWLPKNAPRVWINTFNLAGATGNTLLNDFDSPRVMLEGVVGLNDIRVYSELAATVDRYSDFPGCWPLDQIVEPIIDASVRKNNTVWCSTVSHKFKSDN